MNRRNFFAAISVLIGTCVGAGFLGIPYVASESGFLVALFYLFFLGGIVLLLNLYLGEITLRTKGTHQLTGYTEKYLGKKYRKVMQFAVFLWIYSALLAYMVGVGESFSYLLFGNLNYEVYFGVVFGIFLSSLIWKGIDSLKKYESYGVLVIVILIFVIIGLFVGKIDAGNLTYLNPGKFFAPFGVVLFALGSFFAVPEIKIALFNEKQHMKKVLYIGAFVSIVLYSLFTLVVVGFMGEKTPEVATLALGPIFIILGIITMSTSHLSLGNALFEDFFYDDRYKKFKSWFFAAIVPIFLYLITRFFDFFSFANILSIGGVLSGALLSIMILLTARAAKTKSERIPEYSLPINWFVIFLISLIFIIGVINEFIYLF